MTEITPEATASEATQTEGVPESTTPGSESVEVPTEPDAPRLSVDEYKDHLVPITVDGEEQWVTLEEARRGYSRQADYTRKTQEIAAARQQLAKAEALYNAFQSDPQGTLSALAEHFGVSLAQAQDMVDEAQAEVEDPIAARLETLEQHFQTQQQAEVRSRIDSEFADLHEQYGDFDDNEVIAAALERGITVTDAFKLVNFEKVRAEKQKQAEEEAVLQAKREQAVVADGSSNRNPNVAKAAPKVNSVRDAWNLAKQAR
jgi:hypothetical protein